MNVVESSNPVEKPRRSTIEWLWPVLLLLVLLGGAYFRFTGLDWDQGLHLHPDERFMTMVASSVRSVASLSEYFNTAVSTLNPNNVGYGFYVYGTLPLFIVRYAAEAVDMSGYDSIHLVGRFLSGSFDLLTVLLVFLIARRLYRHSGLAVLAAAFSAASVMHIQLSHYWTVDTFTTFFTYLAIFFVVIVLTQPVPVDPGQQSIAHTADSEPEQAATPVETDKSQLYFRWLTGSWGGILAFILFGAALGMAMASKVSVVLLALLLPAAVAIRFWQAPSQQRPFLAVIFLRNLIIAAIVAFFVFRICQPYAFNGPGFFGIGINPHWVNTMRELSQQSAGDVDFPPALQWARRPITFSWENMVLWGLGLPLGLLAWGGFAWLTVRMIKSLLSKSQTEPALTFESDQPEDPAHLAWPEWQRSSLLWVWVLANFVWQSINFSRSMRYQIPIYPSLAIIAAWAVLALWGRRAAVAEWAGRVRWSTIRRVTAVVLGVVVVLSTAAWAFAFTRIYNRPVTRLAASQWVFQNVPAPVNLKIDQGSELFTHPLAFRRGHIIDSVSPWTLAFVPQNDGVLQTLILDHAVDITGGQGFINLSVNVSTDPAGNDIVASGLLATQLFNQQDMHGPSIEIHFTQSLPVNAGQTYYLVLKPLEENISIELTGDASLRIGAPTGSINQPLPDPVTPITPQQEFAAPFTAVRSGQLTAVHFPHILNWEGIQQEKRLTVSVISNEGEAGVLGLAEITSPFLAGESLRGDAYTVTFDQPIQLLKDHSYTLRVGLDEGAGSLALYGSSIAQESSWDDSIPYGVDGFNAFDFYTGLYNDEYNFEMYWDDNPEKVERFINNLNRTDYIFITSNRQWGTTTRVPERYPLTTYYYRNLIGCPEEQDILWCYRVAAPGDFQGNLGFELVHVEQSDPSLGTLRFNTQFAEEAFTVYDHPKVLIFKKSEDFDPQAVRTMLSSVDVSKAIHLTPRQAGKYKGDLMLPANRLARQRGGGTWSQLFDTSAITNRYPAAGLVLWYLAITLLGWVVYPFVRFALRGLPDRGYPLSRLVGLLLLAYFTWLAGSAGLPATRPTIWIIFALLVVVNAVFFFLQKDAILQELRSRKRYFLAAEALTALFFIFFLLIRLGNPDLWHPSKGGEKPMDFSYLNAVIKSTTFPPYDPWYAGGYLNYYYYGFVIVGVPIEWLGIVPSIAYNLFLPTIFCLVAMAAFSVGWNLLARDHDLETSPGEASILRSFRLPGRPFYAGLASAIGLLILGNLGSLRMLWHGIMRLAPGADLANSNIIERMQWTVIGFGQFLSGSGLPYGPGDWYWIPSRVYPGEPITEFPFFTFLYADPHAHLFAIPIGILAVAWALSIIKGCWQWGENGRNGLLQFGSAFFLGGIAIGALKPTNTWDLYTFLPLGMAAVLWSAFRYAGPFRLPGLNLPRRYLRWGAAVLSALFLVILSLVLYEPFSRWFAQGYTSVEPWAGDKSPFWSYLTHWGLFLFIIISWLIWETRDWMASTPLSHLRRLKPYLAYIEGFIGLLAIAVVVLLFQKIAIGWLVLPLASWAGILILRPGQPDEKRFVLFLVGTGLALTLTVELIHVVGDLGRMNTVFKLYMQAWTLLALSAAAAFLWLFRPVTEEWLPAWRNSWQAVFGALLLGALLFTILAGSDKVRDRFVTQAPHTLDGMTYMECAKYYDQDRELDLSEDYRAIRWMQENVQGSPVIVEANVPEYRWGTRFTIYTGLPGVVGWNWHQRQQRTDAAMDVQQRVDQVGQFYNTTSQDETIAFLQKYDVRYIVVGQYEQAYYSPVGLAKFIEWEGDLWEEVYQDGSTSIYKVEP